MIIAVTVSAIAKKVVELLATNEKGQRFLGYVLGIAAFSLILPVVVILGLFGWMQGDGSTVLSNGIVSGLPEETVQELSQLDDVCKTIAVTFYSYGLSEGDIKKAQEIYLEYLVRYEVTPDFYDALARCFIEANETVSLYDKIAVSFGADIAYEDRQMLDNRFGATIYQSDNENIETILD